MNIQVGISNRHIHLTKEHYKILCGDLPLEVKNPLTQPGTFASTQTFTIKTNKSEIPNVRLLGPFREYTQVEISKTDSYKLGINPPIRTSGEVVDSSPITIVGPKGELNLNEGCIIANRHIHLNNEMVKYYHLEGKEKVAVLIKGEKPGLLGNVFLKVTDEAYFELHLDTDDGNAFLLKSGDIVEIIED